MRLPRQCPAPVGPRIVDAPAECSSYTRATPRPQDSHSIVTTTHDHPPLDRRGRGGRGESDVHVTPRGDRDHANVRCRFAEGERYLG